MLRPSLASPEPPTHFKCRFFWGSVDMCSGQETITQSFARQGRNLGRCHLCQRDLNSQRVVSQLLRLVVKKGVQLREFQRVVLFQLR